MLLHAALQGGDSSSDDDDNYTRFVEVRLAIGGLYKSSPMFKATSPPSPSPPQSHMDWEVVDVLLWLKAVNLEPYCALFQQHDVNGKKLDRMTRSSLEEMGVSDPFHMDNIMECIDELCRKRSTRQNSVVRLCACVRVRVCVCV